MLGSLKKPRIYNLMILRASVFADIDTATVIRLEHVQAEVFPDESSMEKEDPQSGHSGGLWKIIIRIFVPDEVILAFLSVLSTLFASNSF